MALTKASLIDLNGNELILDADADTKIDAATDDEIHFTVAGSETVYMGVTSYNASDRLVLTNTSGNASATIVAGTSGESSIFMADGTSGDASYRGYVQYQHTNDNFNIGTGGSVRLRVDSDGLKFGSDTAAVNALDDYEEGSWTPTLPNGGTTLVRTATYTKVGRHVMAYMYCQFAPTNDSSNFHIGGLPYTVVNNGNYYGGGSLMYSGTEDTSSFSDPLQFYNSTYIYFHYLTGSSASVKNSQFGGRTINLIIQVHYEANT